jgi:uncharacterized membrane protein
MRRILLVLSLAAAPLLPGTAQADLRLCNRTSYILYAATAQLQGGARQIQGWSRVAPGDCATAIKGTVSTPEVYARSALAHSGPQRAWGGKDSQCARDGNFSLKQGASGAACAAGGYAVPFAAIDTAGRDDFTMTFDEQPALPSLQAAQLAGVKRLLKDNGFAVGAIDGKPDKVTGKAINMFRTRMHFPPTAGNAELFAALEAQAQKKVSPAGYTVCNDGKETLLVAMAERAAKGETSRGWWRIAPGACARLVTEPLAGDAIWLLAQKEDGTVIAGGTDRFCVTPQEFEIPRGNCAAHGFTEAGFARTATHGQSGHVAHIDARGLKDK